MTQEHKETTFTYRVYGKLKSARKFKPMNLRNGTFVTNLIYASILSEYEANEQVKFMNVENPEYIFEARKI